MQKTNMRHVQSSGMKMKKAFGSQGCCSPSGHSVPTGRASSKQRQHGVSSTLNHPYFIGILKRMYELARQDCCLSILIAKRKKRKLKSPISEEEATHALFEDEVELMLNLSLTNRSWRHLGAPEFGWIVGFIIKPFCRRFDQNFFTLLNLNSSG